MKQQINKPRRRIHPVHKRIALHTSSVLLVLSAGFLPAPVANFGQTSYDMTVTARVAAPLPTAPAIITDPTDGQRFSTSTITVSGTCPDNSYVKVLRGGDVAGIALCSGNTFTMQITLNPGANTLAAKVFNSTDDEGPTSSPITVYYDVPVPPAPKPGTPVTPGTPAAAAKPGAPGVSGLDAEIPYKYTVRHPNEAWEWNLTVQGGRSPYAVTVNWGDGTSTRYDRGAAGAFEIGHTYNKAGLYRVMVAVTDADGRLVLLELPAVVKDPAHASVNFLQALQSILQHANPWLLWPAYIALLLAVAAFWAYELRALHAHVHQRRLKRHHG